MRACPTWPHCQSDLQIRVCRRSSEKYEFLPHPAPTLFYCQHLCSLEKTSIIRTDSNGLDPDALFEVCVSRVIGILALEDFLSAEGVDKGSSS